MIEILNPANYLRDTIDLTKQIETRFIELAARLYRIKEERLYEGSYEYFNDFLEVAKINPAQASKLISIHRVFIEEGNQTKERLAQIGYSNLYTAIPLVETQGVEMAVVKAETLSRSELTDEIKEKTYGVHEHQIGEDRWGVCSCGKFIKVYEHSL